MEIGKLKAGMKVIIGDNLLESRTRDRFNIDFNETPEKSFMLKMQGGAYTIKEISHISKKVRIRCEDAGRTFIFDPSDIKPFDEDTYYGPPPEPVTFDTKTLDI